MEQTMSEWQRLRLWQTLANRPSAERARLVLQIYMPKVEETLRAGIAASPDFTLHDDKHGYRVAELAAKLSGETLDHLTDSELTLLLLASYCHDIGMSPGRAKIRAHKVYLATGEAGGLSRSEIKDLQRWLDSNRKGITPPIEEGKTTTAGIDTIDDIIAYYSRSRHNDWSEEWIRELIGSGSETLYSGWIDDLVTLCRSHHEGITELRLPRFDARMVGSPATVLNLRYLAAILRVADVMEFAPERTPEVILNHRDIVPSSRIYWYKDHAIAFSLTHEQVLFSARTPSAVIHKAVMMTAEWVDQELSVCSTLEQEGAYRRGLVPEEVRSHYRWSWPGKLVTDIREREGTFVFIDGAFRPDHKKVLALLSGTALYGDKLVAVRELLQNALDAVREQVAYERLSSPDPKNTELGQRLAEIHHVRLIYHREADGYWLKCTDDGSGMTRYIIENNLLVSGSSTRGDLIALARDARKHGFELGRTGQFGIGVLSYFMISDKMVLRSRRSQETGDGDNVGWRFETEGLGSFGELVPESRGSRGSEIDLRIMPEVLGSSPETWFDSVHMYLKGLIRWLPCRVELRNEVLGTTIKTWQPGWTHESDTWKDSLVLSMFPDFVRTAGKIMTAQEEEKANQIKIHSDQVRDDARDLLRWSPLTPFGINEPSAIGRVSIPFFDLLGGPSVAYFDLKPQGNEYVSRESHFPSGRLSTSWQGIAINESHRDTRIKAYGEVDYRNGREVSVDRHSFLDDGRHHLTHIKDAVAGKNFLVKTKTHDLTKLTSPLPRCLCWNVVHLFEKNARSGPFSEKK
jgi:hypothetical protein